MALQDPTRYAFVAEWYDTNADLIRKFHLMYYKEDGTVEMFEIKTRKLFLKKTKVDISDSEWYVGSIINLYSRKLTLTDYADPSTKNCLEGKAEKTLAVLSNYCALHLGLILDIIERNGFSIRKMKMIKLTRHDCDDFEHLEYRERSLLTNIVATGVIIAMELVCKNSVSKWLSLIESDELFNIDNNSATLNQFYGSSTSSDALMDLQLMFDDHTVRSFSSIQLANSTCCVIKPHAVKQGICGRIVKEIQDAGFAVTAIQMFYLDQSSASEFYEVYRDVVSEYNDMVCQMLTGPCIAMEITKSCVNSSEECVKVFRQLVGPIDPVIARQIRSNTLRAKFGENKILNAIHCTDLPEDAYLEIEYFFKILQHEKNFKYSVV